MIEPSHFLDSVWFGVKMSSRPLSTAMTIEVLETRRLLSAITLDTTFGSGGAVQTDINLFDDTAHAVAVQSDGKIVVAGTGQVVIKNHPTNEFVAVRYNTDGSLDTTFGTSGEVNFAEGTSATLSSMVIQKDGKIILAGTGTSSSSIVQQYWAMVRLNVDGTLDTTFGNGGTSSFLFSVDDADLYAIALQSDGKIVGVGILDNDFLVARFDANGSSDPSFGPGGHVTTDFGSDDWATVVNIDSFGNIVVAGQSFDNNNSRSSAVIARYLPKNGALDTTFGTKGKLIIGPESGSFSVGGAVIDSHQDLYLVYNNLEGTEWVSVEDDLRPEGFSEDNHSIGNLMREAVTIAPDGNIIAAGIDLSTGNNRVEVQSSNGSSDTEAIGGNQVEIWAVAAAPDGSIFVAGDTPGTGISGHDFFLAKFTADPPSQWGSVSGKVFSDTDADLVQDPNEKGVPDVQVYDDANHNGVWDDTSEPFVRTDANGNFSLAGLSPGTHTIRETVPTGDTQDLPKGGAFTVTVTAGKTVKGLVFADKPTPVKSSVTEITGSVFNDWNGNRKRDVSKPTEPDLANITVFLDSNLNGKLDKNEVHTTTNAGGDYTLKLPSAGSFRVAIVIPKGWAATTPAAVNVSVRAHAQAVERFGLSLVDPNDTIAEAAKTPLVTTGKAVSGSIAAATDVNMYRFTVRANTTLVIDVDRLRNSTLDSYLRLFNSSGKLLDSNDNAAGFGEKLGVDPFIEYHFLTAGTYYFAISDHLNTAFNPLTGIGDIGGGTTGAYTVTLAAT